MKFYPCSLRSSPLSILFIVVRVLVCRLFCLFIAQTVEVTLVFVVVTYFVSLFSFVKIKYGSTLFCIYEMAAFNCIVILQFGRRKRRKKDGAEEKKSSDRTSDVVNKEDEEDDEDDEEEDDDVSGEDSCKTLCPYVVICL